MNIAGRHDGDIQFIPEFNYFPVEFLKIFYCIYIGIIFASYEKFIVENGLYLQIIIQRSYAAENIVRSAVAHCGEKFTRFAGAPDDKSLAVEFQFGYGDARSALVILRMSYRNELVEIFQSYAVPRYYYLMICFQTARVCSAETLVYLAYIRDIVLDNLDNLVEILLV